MVLCTDPKQVVFGPLTVWIFLITIIGIVVSFNFSSTSLETTTIVIYRL